VPSLNYSILINLGQELSRFIAVVFISKDKKAGLNMQSSSETKCTNGFPIVGIGASAGGLEPITKLLENLPVQTGYRSPRRHYKF